MLYKTLYALFVIAVTFGGSIYIGPFTPRQLFSLIMALYCIFNIKSLLKYIDSVIIAYFFFLLFEGISFSIESRFAIFIRDLISKHFVAIVAYLSTILLYKKTGKYKVLFIPLLMCGILNGIICFLQKIGNPIGLGLGAVFTDLENESIISNFEGMVSGTGNYLFGLMGHPVSNGLFMLISLFIPLYFIKEAHSKTSVFCYVILMLFFYYVIFIIQQRSCLAIATLLILYYLYKRCNLKNIFLIIVIFLPIIIYALSFVDISEFFSGTRYVNRNMHEESRYYLYMSSLAYISNNFLIGGIGSFMAETGNLPHNILLNALIYAGFLGALPIMYIYVKNIFISYQFTCSQNNAIKIASYALIAISLNSLLHNNSIVSGEVFIWIFWAVISVGRYAKFQHIQ